ncbi:hypothetical protein K8I61_12840 [bacterium]|nr:hypothetical protein [bacterium]
MIPNRTTECRRSALVCIAVLIATAVMAFAPVSFAEGESELRELLTTSRGTDPSKLMPIFDLDAIAYYGLKTSAMTPLERKFYMKSDEYQQKLRELKAVRDEAKDATYYFELDVPNYDIGQQGFVFVVRENINRAQMLVGAPHTVNGILFDSIPFYTRPYTQIDAQEPGVVQEYIVIPASEEDGLSIERNRENVRLYVFFKVVDLKSVQYKSFVIKGNERFWKTVETNILVGSQPRLILGDRETGKIFFDKKY